MIRVTLDIEPCEDRVEIQEARELLTSFRSIVLHLNKTEMRCIAGILNIACERMIKQQECQEDAE